MTIEVESLCHYQHHHCLNKIIRVVITIVMVYRHLFLTCGFTNLSRICSTPHFVTFTFKHCLHGIVLTIKDQFNFTNPVSPRSLDFSTLTFYRYATTLFSLLLLPPLISIPNPSSLSLFIHHRDFEFNLALIVCHSYDSRSLACSYFSPSDLVIYFFIS